MEAKERILVRSHELFNKYGIRSVSMDDIAAQLGMSKKTLYLYYTDKEDLVNAVFSGVMAANKTDCQNCQKQCENAIHEVFLSFDMVEDMLTNMNPAVLFDMQKYHPVVFKKFLDYKNDFLYKMIRNNLERGMAEGLYREDLDVDILARFRLFSILLSFDSDVFPGNRTNLVHIEQQLIEHFLYGLVSAKGQKLIEKYKHQRTNK